MEKKFEDGIIFLTTNDRTLNVLDRLVKEGEKIRTLVFPFKAKNENKITNLINFAERWGIAYCRPKIKELENVLTQIGPVEFLITAGYPFILPAGVLSICRFNINIHPTLLPKYRGPNIEWHVIANGENESGVTIHFLHEKADKGAIIEQSVVKLTKFDTIYSLLRKTAEIEPELLMRAIEKLRKGFPGIPQNEVLATYYPNLRTPEDSQLDPKKSLSELFDFIRACDPQRFPAFFYVNGEKVAVKLFRPDKPSDEPDLI